MTELKHGSNVAGLQTEAVLDVATDEWVIHTPDDGAIKWYLLFSPSIYDDCTVSFVEHTFISTQVDWQRGRGRQDGDGLCAPQGACL